MPLRLPPFSWQDAVVLVGLIGLVIFKAGYLDLPFYWDEAWVYEPAVHAMSEGRIGLLPSSLAPELSRGHPLLFHALAAGWSKLFGDSRVVLHLFALTVGILLIVATYRFASASGSRTMGAMAALLVAVNNKFLAQSGLLLPEIMLALFLVLAIHALVVESMPWFAVWGTCALFTKETAIAPLAAVVAWTLVESISGQRPGRKIAKDTAMMAMPFLAIGAFFVIQRVQRGWFLFPEHVDLMAWGIKHIVYKAKLAFTIVFEEQATHVLLYAFSIAAPLLSKRLPWPVRLLIPLLYITAIKVLWGRWTLPLVPTLIVPVLCLAAVFLLYRRVYPGAEDRSARMLHLSFLAVVALWAFGSLNFFSERYFLPCLPFLAVGATVLIRESLSQYHAALPGFVLGAIVVVIAAHIGRNGTIRDVDLGYADAIRMTQQRIGFCESQDLYEARIKASFVDVTYMSRMRSGYLSGQRVFSNVFNGPVAEAEYFLVNGPPDGEEAREAQESGFVLVQEFRHGIAQGAIYRRP